MGSSVISRQTPAWAGGRFAETGDVPREVVDKPVPAGRGRRRSIAIANTPRPLLNPRHPVAAQRYQAVMAVIGDGLSISQVAEKVGVSRQTLHAWLARYEAEGLEGLADRSHRPVSCPHQMGAEVEAALLELRRSPPYWGPRRLVFELAKRRVRPVPSESAAHRALVRAGMIDVSLRDRGSRKWKRWERGAPMKSWTVS